MLFIWPSHQKDQKCGQALATASANCCQNKWTGGEDARIKKVLNKSNYNKQA